MVVSPVPVYCLSCVVFLCIISDASNTGPSFSPDGTRTLRGPAPWGPHHLSPGLVKEVSWQIAFPIPEIFDKLLQGGKVPNDRKLAYVVAPIYRKGNRKFASNYRPNSLTSVSRKILETVISDETVKFLNDKLIIENQHGPRNEDHT